MSGMDTTPYQQFATTKLGFEFENIDLLITAFTHRSYVNEHRKSTHEHNERLEFLGDAVLELVVTDYLYKNYAEPEGILTNWRSALVRTESIGAAGEGLDYLALIRLSRGEKRGSERAKQQILANAFEALAGAIYLEKGYDVASEFIAKHILSKLPGILESGTWRDAKSRLQGPDHDKIFTLGVFVDGELLGKGSGPSKQIAQQQAAEVALVAYKEREPKVTD
jgi:ribonuclease-3